MHNSQQDNMYSFDMKNIVPKESLTCLVAKATLDESMLWHRRLGHINFKNINKLVKDNLVRGLPTKHFENDQPVLLVLKGSNIELLDETSEILKNFIKEIENLVDKKVKIIRSDNGTEFKNKVMDDFCREKGIKREYSVAKTPQQNGVAERRNRTLIEAARTMLDDFKLPTTFWAEAVSTACYVQNKVLVVKPHNKTPYELFRGFKPALSFMRPFGCHVTILNTLESLGKFDGKSNEKKVEGSEEKAKSNRMKMLGKKRAGKEQQQESPKRQKLEDDKETNEHEEVESDDTDELKKHLVIKKDDDIAIDAIPLATKPPVIVEYKLLKEGIMVHYQLIRAYGSSKRYSSMIRLLQGIDREDLQTLWKLIKTKHGDSRPEDDHEKVLWGDLKVMFEPDIKSDVWRNLQGYKVTIWKLFDSCGVHFVRRLARKQGSICMGRIRKDRRSMICHGASAKDISPCQANGPQEAAHGIRRKTSIKGKDGTWKVRVDYFSLNKVCARDMYPFPEEGEELVSLMGYPYKCFLRLPKEYNQIRMAEDDEEKTRFHTEEGVRADTEKLQAIILSPTPKSPNQIRNLFLQLTVISKFIPKMAELPYPIRMVRVRSEATKGSGWTYEAEEALQRIKRKLNKLQTLAVTKEVKKFFGQREQIQEILDENERGTSNLNKELQAKSTPTPRAWWLYLGKETIEEGFGVGIILVSPEERMHSYAILLKFNTSDYANDCEALLAGLAVSVLAHTPSENFELQSRGVDMIGNHKVGIPQSRSIDVYQNKTIGGRDKQQQEGKSNEQCAKCKTKL
ncbi:putative ribonuclease H-like domain-containing protein [Tanacetum coccineum]